MTPTSVSSWLSTPQPRPEATIRLFCFLPAGAGASLFHSWSQALPSFVEVSTLQLPGREARIHETPLTDMAALVDDALTALQPSLDRPFGFFGHSLGGWVSFELARTLSARQRPGLRHLFVAGCGAPYVAEPSPPIHALPDDQFLEAIKRLNGTPEAALAHPELMALVLPALRADFTVYETYRYVSGARLGCGITALGGQLDPRVSRSALEAWAGQTTGRFDLRLFEGDHFFLNSAQPDVVKTVVDTLHGHAPS